MKSFSFIGLLCALALATGCGGSSFSGGESGAAGSDESGGSGANGGSANGGSANGGSPGSGGSGAGSGGGVTAGSAGTCGSIGSGCCESDFDCPVAGVCMQCKDGSFVCPSGHCSNGLCFSETPECPDGCGSDTDCGAPSCAMCADGSSACSSPTCVSGRCVTRPPVCNPDPCANLACGEPCTTAEAGGGSGSGESAYMTCNANGVCVYGASECVDRCDSPDDCVLPDICISCADGTCAQGACQSGVCTRVCPSGRQPCAIATDCPTPPPICIECPNGGCQGPACIDHECRTACATTTACMSDIDCPACSTCYVPQGDADVACYPGSCHDNLCLTPCN